MYSTVYGNVYKIVHNAVYSTVYRMAGPEPDPAPREEESWEGSRIPSILRNGCFLIFPWTASIE